MADFLGYLCNCLIVGNEFTEPQPRRRVRNKIAVELDGYKCDILQHPDVLSVRPSQAQGVWLHTTDVLVHNVSRNDVSSVRDILHDLAHLLAFATQSRVWHFGYEYPAGSGRKIRERSIGSIGSATPVISTISGRDVHAYITSAWDKYKKEKKRRNLPIIVDWLVQAEQGNKPIELKLVVIFLVLESLKDSYARTSHIPFVRGRFRRISTPPRANPAREPTLGFEELLDQTFRDVGMRRGLKRIVKLRNELFHSAIARRPFGVKWHYYLRGDDLIREYLLRLLGYKGRFLSRKKARPKQI